MVSSKHNLHTYTYTGNVDQERNGNDMSNGRWERVRVKFYIFFFALIVLTYYSIWNRCVEPIRWHYVDVLVWICQVFEKCYPIQEPNNYDDLLLQWRRRQSLPLMAMVMHLILMMVVLYAIVMFVVDNLTNWHANDLDHFHLYWWLSNGLPFLMRPQQMPDNLQLILMQQWVHKQ